VPCLVQLPVEGAKFLFAQLLPLARHLVRALRAVRCNRALRLGGRAIAPLDVGDGVRERLVDEIEVQGVFRLAVRPGVGALLERLQRLA